MPVDISLTLSLISPRKQYLLCSPPEIKQVKRKKKTWRTLSHWFSIMQRWDLYWEIADRLQSRNEMAHYFFFSLSLSRQCLLCFPPEIKQVKHKKKMKKIVSLISSVMQHWGLYWGIANRLLESIDEMACYITLEMNCEVSLHTNVLHVPCSLDSA